MVDTYNVIDDIQLTEEELEALANEYEITPEGGKDE